MCAEPQGHSRSGVSIARTSTPSVQPPVSKLIPEILLIIFQLSVANRQSQKSTQQRRNSQVCQFWREVALGCAWLWASELHISSPHLWFREAVRRSANVPFTLSNFTFVNNLHSSYARRAEENFDYLLGNVSMSRCTNFDISFHEKGSVRLLRTWAAFQQPMPHLRNFRLIFRARIRSYHSKQFQAVQTNFCGNHAPKLESLVVSNICSLDSISSCFANLRTLDISTIHAPPSSSQWLQVLQATPSLEDLQIYQGFSDEDGRDISRKRVVRLDHLVRLHFIGNLPAQAHILSHLVLPRINDLNICSYYDVDPSVYKKDTIDTYQNLANALDRVYKNHSRAEESILYISSPRSNRLEVSFFPAGSEEGQNFCLDLLWDNQDELIPIFRFLTNLDCFMSSVDIVRVNLCLMKFTRLPLFFQPPQNQWQKLRQLAQPFHDLLVQLDQDLELRIETLPSLLMLCECLLYGNVMCSLQTVCFNYINLDDDDNAVACKQTLLFLRSRQNVGGHRKLVVKSEWNPTGEHARAFKSQVNQMDWIDVDCHFWLV